MTPSPCIRPQMSQTQHYQAACRRHTHSPPIAGFLDDYAFVIAGLLDLYEATFQTSWLEWPRSCSRGRTRSSGTLRASATTPVTPTTPPCCCSSKRMNLSAPDFLQRSQITSPELHVESKAIDGGDGRESSEEGDEANSPVLFQSFLTLYSVVSKTSSLDGPPCPLRLTLASHSADTCSHPGSDRDCFQPVAIKSDSPAALTLSFTLSFSVRERKRLAQPVKEVRKVTTPAQRCF
ncbi:hypothetical protein WMY93_032014 [Mugilogobius chulae]|uniref:Uncharacterized protein n=1 Tax=Mugilogobius chulae TaxID=88201 RepID=A0AAW0MDB3_9GOBI